MIRDALWEPMWNDIGIVRDRAGLRRARDELAELDARMDETGIDARDLRYNLTWHDWLNLKNLILVGRAIAEAALWRGNSRGAHLREDFPEPSDLATSHYGVITLDGGEFRLRAEPVRFTRVRPGESLV